MESELQILYKELNALLKADLNTLTENARPIVYDAHHYKRDIDKLKNKIERTNQQQKDRVNFGCVYCSNNIYYNENEYHIN